MSRFLRPTVSCLFGLAIRVLGWVTLLWLLAAMTSLPWNLLEKLAADMPGGETLTPEVLVVLGGGGIPSESGLIRTFAAAQYAKQYPQAQLVVAMPSGEGDLTGQRMVDELVMRGVNRQRIRQETQGRNTREQAVYCHKLLAASGAEPVVGIVTSPEHIRRSLLAFHQAGLTQLKACPAWDSYLEVDLTYGADEVKATQWNPVSNSLLVRYKFWDRLVLQAKLLREGVAILYYRWMGWIK
ncbi:MAG: YdcF family protein [Kiritimatiellae bacterium]|nr:YdcF family protein [Kiritimatiellia bacterium]